MAKANSTALIASFMSSLLKKRLHWGNGAGVLAVGTRPGSATLHVRGDAGTCFKLCISSWWRSDAADPRKVRKGQPESLRTADFSSKILPPNWPVGSSNVLRTSPMGLRVTSPRLPRHALLVPGMVDRCRREEEPMNRVEVAILAGVMLLGGCATKRYVADQVDPVNAKVGEVDQKQQSTQRQLDEAENKISAADEKATSADARAGDAIGRADAAAKKSDQVKEELRGELNDRIANLDDYKSAGDVTVLFKFNSSELTSEGK